MKKSCFPLFFALLAYTATAQHQHPHELQIAGFRIPDGEKDHFVQLGYFYNINHRNAIGIRASYHSERVSEFYKKQIRFIEASHRWRFQKPEKKFAWTLSAGPWAQFFTSQAPVSNGGDRQSGTLGAITTGGLHYYMVPRLSLGFTGFSILEATSWDQSGFSEFNPLITPGLGFQLTYHFL